LLAEYILRIYPRGKEKENFYYWKIEIALAELKLWKDNENPLCKFYQKKVAILHLFIENIKQNESCQT
jgi:hypothetical protein